jgi:hypothetical protein
MASNILKCALFLAGLAASYADVRVQKPTPPTERLEIADYLEESFRNDEKVRQEVAAFKLLVMRNEIEAINETNAALRRNRVESLVICVVAHLFLALGILAAWMEFSVGLRIRRHTPVTEISVGIGGVAFKSAVLGTIILALSMAFYLGYIHFVYPVQQMDSALKPVYRNEVNAHGKYP